LQAGIAQLGARRADIGCESAQGLNSSQKNSISDVVLKGTGFSSTANGAALKGTGFSPYANACKMGGALAPEGTQFPNPNSLSSFPHPVKPRIRLWPVFGQTRSRALFHSTPQRAKAIWPEHRLNS
jgi:hypothetical protein